MVTYIDIALSEITSNVWQYEHEKACDLVSLCQLYGNLLCPGWCWRISERTTLGFDEYCSMCL